MAAIVLTDATITIGGNAVTAYTNSVTLTYEKDQVEITAMGDNTHKFTGGLVNLACDIELYQDFTATTGVEATLYPLVGSPTTVVIKPTSSATSSTNPQYTLTNTTLVSHTPINGKVGEVATTSLSFKGGSLAKAVV